ncbi:DUF21 domain-containing protein [Mycoplasmopsis phocirhinis]|uniref:DUF21 domain-containing protein n=1 Tax=Mycoplasmopsis phocirhinis TaxID=142650 RepID=A0A4P6MMA5_9BACT|nr:CNNM domain-containing protein [Mycoplasmopsis phocirhinis]QBF34765.1 DUF21 domain-containing protein [Mycoplasmopsis phocirhinis]
MDQITIILVPLLIILLILSSIFSSCETAYSTLNPGKLETMIDRNEFGAKIIKKQYSFFNRILALILIWNNIANIGLSSALSYVMSRWLVGDISQYAALISTVVLTPIVVILGEIIPKLIAKSYPEKVAKTFCYPLQGLYYLFFPIIWLISKISKNIYVTNTEQDVKNLIDVAHTEGILEANESIMAQNALDLDTTKVRKHFIKLKDMSFISYKASIEQALEIFKETNYSRLPIEKNGEFLGIVLLKDIFYRGKGKVIDYIKTIPRISANSTLAIALETLRLQRSHMAFVTNNNSSREVLGILTIEDILEEIVGEIYDEYDEEELDDFFEISLELFRVNGRVKMRQLISRMNLDFDIEDNLLNMNVQNFVKRHNHGKISKTSKIEFQGVFFKVISTPNKKHKYYHFEVEIGTQAPVSVETNTEI